MSINYSKIPKVLHDIGFHTADDPDWDPYDLKVTEACSNALDAANQAVAQEEMMGDQKIRNFIRKYPKIPMFKNHLWRFYINMRLPDQALDVAQQAIHENPAYFYSRLMLANSLLMIPARRHEIPELLSHWNIVEYAGREKFIYHEVLNYYLLVAEYHHRNSDKKQAQGFLYFLEVMGLGDAPAFVQVKQRMG